MASVAALLVVVDLFLVVFSGQDQVKCPTCLQAQHRGLLPSTTTILNGMRDVLKPSSIQTDGEKIVTLWHPTCGFGSNHIFNAAIPA